MDEVQHAIEVLDSFKKILASRNITEYAVARATNKRIILCFIRLADAYILAANIDRGGRRTFIKPGIKTGRYYLQIVI